MSADSSAKINSTTSAGVLEPTRLKVATAQYPIDRLPDWSAYEAKIGQWVTEAVAAGAQLLLFPEYGGMELAGLFPDDIATNLRAQLSALQTWHRPFWQLWQKLAQRHQIYLIAPSLPVRLQGEAYVNRAYFLTPAGNIFYQDKWMMTRFEREEWGISGAPPLHLFDTPIGKWAINICYDSEFPLLAQRQCAAGAEVLFVPSCTDTLAGYYRVRIGCQARALENQCYVVQSPTVGVAPWSPAVDVNVGAAGVFAPADRGLPADGVIALGMLNEPGWVYADLDLAALRRVRTDGQVLNFRDWPEQLAGPVEVQTFSCR